MTTGASTLSALSAELAALVERASAFVVSVDGRHGRPASGIVFAPDVVVTADHVLEREEDIDVRIGERRLGADIAGRDPGTDVAVLRVKGPGGVEPSRSGSARPGQLVISVSRTPTAAGVAAGLGVVAAVGGPLRTGSGVVLREVIRTEAPAYRGASGGAIVDTDGRVLAMTTSGLLRGMPVGIPCAQLWPLASMLLTNGSVKRAYLGVSVQPVRLPGAVGEGVTSALLVAAVAPDGAAHRAGLLVGDVLTAANGSPLRHMDDLQDRLAGAAPGSTVTLGLIRGGATRELAVVTGER